MTEVLSPAGTYESFKAAVCAGADAVYLGGSMFGARAYAGNFNEEELLRAIDYAHVHGRKVYLTVNTLIRDDELRDRLYSYLLPYYREGLDAVIVQDYGVFNFVKNNFPDMDIHASTQMTITGHNGASLLKRLGASRIVTARELDLGEIRKIREESDIEIESFVHGALCYCYSGQCLMSSLIGGRSGNRGRCAQSCRLPYDVYIDDRQINDKDQKYILSTKDMCALNILPQIIKAGVNSLKIEGRMKSPEYTAGVVSLYRKYVDIYMESGEEKYRVSDDDIRKLMDLYNRGNFTKGYYSEKNGRDMLSVSRPNHCGVRALKVVSAKKGSFFAKALTELNAGDVIEITPDYEITIGVHDAGADMLNYNIPARFKVKEGQVLYRTRNNSLINYIRETYIEKDAKTTVSAELTLECGRPSVLSLKCRDISVNICAGKASAAQNRPVTEEQMIKQLSKFGNTPFVLNDIKINMKDNIFIPVGVINDIRREAADELEKALAAEHFRKETTAPEYSPFDGMTYGRNDTLLSAGVTNEDQLEAVVQSGIFSRIYADTLICEKSRFLNIVEYVHNNGMEIYLAFPHIFRKQAENVLDGMSDTIKECSFDGFLVRSLCELEYIKKNGFTGKIVSDHNMYTFNRESAAFLRNAGIDVMTAPAELNEKELYRLGICGMEIIGYGYYPMMISAQCVMKTLKGCKKGTEQENGMVWLRDRKSKNMAVKSNCTFCYSTIYNESPVWLMDMEKSIKKLNPSFIRAEFTIENRKETEEIINKIKNGGMPERYTRGHFTRGVE